MDQFVIDFEFSMLYFDVLDLIDLIEASPNNELKSYVEGLKDMVDNQLNKN